MNKRIQTLSLAGAAALSAAGIFGVTLVSAQTSPTPTTTPSTQGAAPSADRAQDQANYIAALATNLGISQSALEAAISKTNSATIDQLEASGKITAEQATSMRERLASGTGVQFFIGGGPGGPGGPPGGEGRGGPGGHIGSAGLATLFGVTEDQLRTELQGGKSLAQVAAAHNVSRDALKSFLTTENQTRLAADVTAGRLTQAQADEKLAQFSSTLDARIDAVGPMGGGPGDHGPRPGAPAPTAG